ncbi:MAG: hypothetical protein IAE91_10355 [Ignavibacteriaceae bacterium]|nr:hypothetical protein [Ignavibacteriaceae bacterium]
MSNFSIFIQDDLDLIKSEIFTNEDISKPENRLNLAIFHLQMYQPFHDWFCGKLDIKNDSVIYPTQTNSGSRPDFIIRNGNQIIGYVEVELGSENTAQLAEYRRKYKAKVYSISGYRNQGCDLGLDEMEEYIKSELKNNANVQTKTSLIYLLNLISTFGGRNSSNIRVDVSEKMLNHPFVSQILNNLSEFAPPNGESKKPFPGYYYIDTVKESGFSFKVYSRISKNKLLSIFAISGGREQIIIQSSKKYDHYLQDRETKHVNDWVNFIINEFGCRIDNLDFDQRLSIPIHIVQKKIDKFTDLIKPLI